MSFPVPYAVTPLEGYFKDECENETEEETIKCSPASASMSANILHDHTVAASEPSSPDDDTLSCFTTATNGFDLSRQSSIKMSECPSPLVCTDADAEGKGTHFFEHGRDGVNTSVKAIHVSSPTQELIPRGADPVPLESEFHNSISEGSDADEGKLARIQRGLIEGMQINIMLSTLTISACSVLLGAFTSVTVIIHGLGLMMLSFTIVSDANLDVLLGSYPHMVSALFIVLFWVHVIMAFLLDAKEFMLPSVVCAFGIINYRLLAAQGRQENLPMTRSGFHVGVPGTATLLICVNLTHLGAASIWHYNKFVKCLIEGPDGTPAQQYFQGTIVVTNVLLLSGAFGVVGKDMRRRGSATATLFKLIRLHIFNASFNGLIAGTQKLEGQHPIDIPSISQMQFELTVVSTEALIVLLLLFVWEDKLYEKLLSGCMLPKKDATLHLLMLFASEKQQPGELLHLGECRMGDMNLGIDDENKTSTSPYPKHIGTSLRNRGGRSNVSHQNPHNPDEDNAKSEPKLKYTHAKDETVGDYDYFLVDTDTATKDCLVLDNFIADFEARTGRPIRLWTGRGLKSDEDYSMLPAFAAGCKKALILLDEDIFNDAVAILKLYVALALFPGLRMMTILVRRGYLTVFSRKLANHVSRFDSKDVIRKGEKLALHKQVDQSAIDILKHLVEQCHGRFGFNRDICKALQFAIDGNCRSAQLGTAGFDFKLLTNCVLARGAKVIRTPNELPRSSFEVLNTIASGEFGTVKLGRTSMASLEGNSDLVAIKQLRDDIGDHVEDFLLEATIAAQFKHPNIMELVGVITISYPMMMIFKYCAHGDLLSIFTKFDGTEDDFTDILVSYFVGIANGMKFLASKNFVHRDLAARNVLVDESNTPMISDFGLSREIESSEYYTMHGLTQKLPVRWCSIEVLMSQRFSEKSDVWAFGILMSEGYNIGQTPYSEIKDMVQIYQHILDGNIIRKPPRCPMTIYDHIMKPLFARNPSERPTFQILCEMLDHAADGVLPLVDYSSG